MHSHRIFALCLRHWYLIRDNPNRLIQIFGWVFFDIVLWGFLSRYLAAVTGDTQFTPLFLGAILVWYFNTRVMHGVATAFFEDVWSRNFLNIFASPLKLSEYVASLVIVGLATSIVGLAFMIGIARLLFGFSILGYGLPLALFLLVLVLSGIALGISSVALVLRLGPSAEWLIWPIPEMLSPFVGVFYPIAVLPVWLQWLAYLLPPSYVFEGIRALVLGGTISAAAQVAAAALALLYIAIAYVLLSRVYRAAVRTGLIARYSAESTF